MCVDGHLRDSGYSLSMTMMTLYKDNGHLLDEQIHYNNIHASIRSTIERAFGRLKGKWRRLKYLDASDMNIIKDHVLASCVLHNFLLINCDVSNDDFDQEVITEEGAVMEEV